MYDYGLFIGRFQPFHNGHFESLKFALTVAQKIIIVLGGYKLSPSLHDPWTTQNRKKMILDSLDAKTKKKLKFIFLRDRLYNEELWKENLKVEVQLNTHENASIVLIGHEKDESSYYLKIFPEWKFIETGNFLNNLSSTQIRLNYFKNIPHYKANIIVCKNNFHGRTTTIVGFSSEKEYNQDFGPYDNGFTIIPFGDADALEKAITPNTAAFLFEPIQGEGGVLVPPDGYLTRVSEICKKHRVLCIIDEIQTGLARTGKFFAHWYEEGCKPDMMLLGKALGGGFYPISAVVGSKEALGVFVPGSHGSTFGGNPMACALSRTALQILIDENLTERSYKLGEKFRDSLRDLPKHVVNEVRGRGLLNAVEVQKDAGDGHFYVEMLARMGILSKETHKYILRFAPPLTIEESSLDFALDVMRNVFSKTQKEWEKNLDIS